MKALKIVALATGIAVLGMLALMMAAPTANHLESTIIINASASAVFREANGFKSFNTWSPLSDPGVKYSYTGPDSGVGARVSWDGPQVGRGYREITDSEENQLIRHMIIFEGQEGQYMSEIRLEPVDGGTKVIWTYDSDYSQAAGMSGSMEKVVEMFTGPSLQGRYDAGLKALKQVVERKPELD
jgi:hypothetical protein